MTLAKNLIEVLASMGMGGALQPDGGVYAGNYIRWSVEDEGCELDGEFTPAELRAIADHMDKYGMTAK